ncbi:MAG: tetratricopeptide repeat protein [Verrucomicrobiia bacterium]
MNQKFSASYILCLLFVLIFGLACYLERWQLTARQNQATPNGGILSAILWESRSTIGALLYLKADVYFHRGFYPSIFDNLPASGAHSHNKNNIINEENNALSNDTDSHSGHLHQGDNEREKCEKDISSSPLDWIDSLSRNFYPSVHVHANELPGGQKEILPWLKLAAMFDPQRIESYTVAAFWLKSIGKINEAEEFLRDGLRANPENPELLFELGKLNKDNKKDIARARNLLEFALARWKESAAKESEPNTFLLQQILANLAQLERDQKNYPLAIKYFEELKKHSPNPQAIQKQIDDMKEELQKGG